MDTAALISALAVLAVTGCGDAEDKPETAEETLTGTADGATAAEGTPDDDDDDDATDDDDTVGGDDDDDDDDVTDDDGEDTADDDDDDDDDSSDGVDGECTQCGDLESWPTTADEALYRSSYWDPDIQQVHNGDYVTSAAGEIVENLHIVDGMLIIEHDDVVARNITTEGRQQEDAGNHPIRINNGAQNVVIEGILMGPPGLAGWDNGCDMPMFPASGFMSGSEATWEMRACATRHVGDSVKANDGTGVFEDCFFEIAMGIWAVEACQPDHTDSVQLSNGDANLTFRRIWMDALRYVVDGPDEIPVQADNAGGATGLQLGGNVSGAVLSYDKVRLFSGNYSLRIFGGVTLSIVDSLALGYTHGPLLTGGGTNLTIDQWSGNTLGDGSDWLAP